MRVLFVTHSYPRAEGDVAGAFLLRLAAALGQRGVSVEVLAPAGPGLAPHAVIGGIPVARFRYAPTRWETLAYTGTMAEQVRQRWTGKLALAGLVAGGAFALRRAVRQFRPDVVHAHWWFPLGLSAAMGPAVPLVVTLHGSDVRVATGNAAARSAFRAVTARARAVTAVSHWLADRVAAIAPDCECTVAPMPADASLLVGAPDSVRRGVLFVGRLNAQKGVADLIDAAALLQGADAIDIVGDGPDRATLEAQAARVGIASRVRWHGAVAPADVAGFYHRAAVVVVPSRDEGLGLVAVESLLAGAPVVAYRSGGLNDVVSHGESGLLVEPGDRRALAAAIAQLLADPATAARMGRSGRSALLARFSPESVAATYHALYQAVAA